MTGRVHDWGLPLGSGGPLDWMTVESPVDPDVPKAVVYLIINDKTVVECTFKTVPLWLDKLRKGDKIAFRGIPGVRGPDSLGDCQRVP